MPQGAARRRRSKLGQIQIGMKQLFHDDSDYRHTLQAIAGVRSAAELDEAGRPDPAAGRGRY